MIFREKGICRYVHNWALQESPMLTITRIISKRDIKKLADIHKRRKEAARWYSAYRQGVEEPAPALRDEDINQLVHELR